MRFYFDGIFYFIKQRTSKILSHYCSCNTVKFRLLLENEKRKCYNEINSDKQTVMNGTLTKPT